MFRYFVYMHQLSHKISRTEVFLHHYSVSSKFNNSWDFKTKCISDYLMWRYNPFLFFDFHLTISSNFSASLCFLQTFIFLWKLIFFYCCYLLKATTNGSPITNISLCFVLIVCSLSSNIDFFCIFRLVICKLMPLFSLYI